MDINATLIEAIKRGASDLHLTVGIPPMLRIDGQLMVLGTQILLPKDTQAVMEEIIPEGQKERFMAKGEADFSYSIAGTGRFRVNVFRQRGALALVLRVVRNEIPTPEELGLPPVVMELADKHKGLIIVTGPTGSGKSTTLATMVNHINHTRKGHIITLEDPVEYLHKHQGCIVNQREVGEDTQSFGNALRAALRQDPDVILVGEMRDLETISTAITAAETGHLVLTTLHTNSADQTVDRMIDVFPSYQQQQIRVQLAATLLGVVAQQLIPRDNDKGRVAALEIMIATPAIKNMIREGKTQQILSSIQMGGKFGMQTMDGSLVELYRKGIISYQEVQERISSVDVLSRLK